LGLYRILAPNELAVIANTGDDFEHLGLHISPDIDTLLYALSERDNRETGWGRAAETWSFMSALQELGAPIWFALGDKDLAVHVFRSMRLRQGKSLCEVTQELTAAFGVTATVWPMSNQVVRTRIRSDEGWLNFQNYFVQARCAPRVRELNYVGADRASAAPEAISALREQSPEMICICPSNPYLSIDPILAVPGIRTWLASFRVPIIAIAPIVGGRAVKGPTAKIMNELGLESSVTAIARHYLDFIDALVIDTADRSQAAAIKELGIHPFVTDTVMTNLEDRCSLARQVMAFAETLRSTNLRGQSYVGSVAR
jgi:LPPG:FO 2-phospho-L-lactate transferase